MQDKWYGDLRFWKFSRVGMPLDPTRKLTSSAVKKISSQLLTGTWHLCYCRWGNIQWLYAQMTPHWKPREFNSLIKHCYLQFHFNITSHKPQRLKKKSLSSYAHASFTLPPCPSGEGFVQCWYTGVICLWQKHCISSLANYNGQHMRSSSLSAWDPRKGNAKNPIGCAGQNLCWLSGSEAERCTINSYGAEPDFLLLPYQRGLLPLRLQFPL